MWALWKTEYMNFMKLRWALPGVLALGLSGSPLAAATWFSLGPYGGDARSFAVDPHDSGHIYLGTATGWIFDSHDGGKTWKRLSKVGRRDDLVLDHILIDPADAKHLTVAGWIIDHPDGGLYESRDGGLNWYSQAEMRGQSVRALAAAPSNPKIMVAGTLLGVYRTTDGGLHWRLISPAGSSEIHEVESIAIDPVDPDVIYAGTWHLPWKTTDGGKSWANIKQGIIDDSDVFSIIVDPSKHETVYASACSGIYKSTNAGAKFAKIQGIPSSARRTRKLTQDPTHLDTVFAGTTEGLYRTLTAGSTWERMTGSDVIVNDVLVDPKNANHVLLATDRAGVLASEDGGSSFQASNTGFSARQVTSFAYDPRHPSTVFVGVVNDKDAGGVFVSHNGGVTWRQQSAGLGGRDVFSLAALPDGSLLAGTNHGIFRLQGSEWTPSGLTVPLPAVGTAPVTSQTGPAKPGLQRAAHPVPHSKAVAKAPVKRVPLSPGSEPQPQMLDAAVWSMASTDSAVYAGTSQGLLRSAGDGSTWTHLAAPHQHESRYLAAYKDTVLSGNLRELAVSVDAGAHWKPLTLPQPLTQLTTVAVDEQSNLWCGGPEGVFYSGDRGTSWKNLQNLYLTFVSGVYFDPIAHRVLVTSSRSTVVFSAHIPDFKVTYWDSGWNLNFVRPAGDHLLGITMFDGTVVQPQMVESKMTGGQ